jgi:hypothetical protein
MAADMVAILPEHAETLTLQAESAITYSDNGTPTVTYASPGTSISGSWQPVSGATIREEVGRATKSTAQVMVANTVAPAAGARIKRADNTWKYVNYVKTHMGHNTILLRDTAGNL